MPNKRTTTKENWKEAARLLREATASTEFTTAELVKRSGVSDTTLRHYQSGGKMGRVDKRRDLAAALGLPNDDVFFAVATGATSVEQALSDQQVPAATAGPLQDEALREAVVHLTQRVEQLLENLPDTWTGDPPPDPRSP